MASIPTTIRAAPRTSQTAARRTLATSPTTDTTPKHRHTLRKGRQPIPYPKYPTLNLPLKDAVTTPLAILTIRLAARQPRHLGVYPRPTSRRGLNTYTRLANSSSTKSFRGNENEGKSYTSSRSRNGGRDFKRGLPQPRRNPHPA